MNTHPEPISTNHPAVEAAARVALADGWTCDTHEPLPWGECRDCTESHLRTAPRALTAALPHLEAATRDARADALTAVLELHHPITATVTSRDGMREVTVCAHCAEPAWPCATVAPIYAALPHLAGAPLDAATPERLPCGCENPLNAVHLLDH